MTPNEFGTVRDFVLNLTDFARHMEMGSEREITIKVARFENGFSIDSREIYSKSSESKDPDICRHENVIGNKRPHCGAVSGE